MAFSGVAFGLPFAMNSAEGTEASMFVAAAASRSTWRRAMQALLAGLVTLVPVAALIWVIFHFVGANDLDYAIAAVVFLLGCNELREGLGERPARRGQGDRGVTGPTGLAPASRASITAFQRDHGLEPTGVIDQRTRAALRAARAEQGVDRLDPALVGADVADEESVRAVQRRHGLRETGVVDDATRGALRVAQQQGMLDALDPEGVRRFQRRHGLPATGDVDDATVVAVATARGEGATTIAPDERIDPATALAAFDAGDADSVRRFQRTLGLQPDGTVGPETRGALLAMRARLHPDPGDADAIRRFQSDSGLGVTGCIDAGTRQAAAATLDRALHPRSEGLAPDPADVGGVEAFQRFFDLRADGVIDEQTRQAIRYARDWFCDVDPTSERSIGAFQARHGLEPDGVIGARTQAALASARGERYAPDGKERKRRYGPLAASDGAGPLLVVDLADAGDIARFQRAHHLPDDGVVDLRTREALAVARLQRVHGDGRVGDHAQARSGGPVSSLRSTLGDAWPAYVGVILETSEALLYSFAIVNSKFAFVPAVLGAAFGFLWPWMTLPLVRRLTDAVAEWKQELTIGLVLVGVSTTFGLLHAIAGY